MKRIKFLFFAVHIFICEDLFISVLMNLPIAMYWHVPHLLPLQLDTVSVLFKTTETNQQLIGFYVANLYTEDSQDMGIASVTNSVTKERYDPKETYCDLLTRACHAHPPRKECIPFQQKNISLCSRHNNVDLICSSFRNSLLGCLE